MPQNGHFVFKSDQDLRESRLRRGDCGRGAEELSLFPAEDGAARMIDPGRKETLEREAVAYIRLGTLLQRERSAEKSELVAQVVASRVPIEEKVRRIERIDSQAAMAEERRSGPRGAPIPAPGAAVPGAATPAAAAPAETSHTAAAAAAAGRHPTRTKESVLAAARRRARRKADIVPSTFLKYLFREGPAIRAKARANGFLKAGFTRLTLKSETVRVFLDHTKRQQLPALGAALDLALKEGWRFLTKRDYNLLAALRRLVTEVGALQLQPDSHGYAPPSRRLFSIEIAFLTFVGFRDDQRARRDRLFGLESLLARLSYPTKAAEEALAAGTLLLKDGGPPLCLQDFILAVNMVRAQRHLSIADLLRPEGEELVSASEFDCGEEVQLDIDAHIAALLDRLDELSAEGEETLRLRAFVRRDSEGEVDFAPLESFYESSTSKKTPWERDAENVIALVAGLAEGLLASLASLFEAPPRSKAAAAGIQAPGQGATRGATSPGAPVLDPAIEYEISRLRATLAKILRGSEALPSLSWARFMTLRAKTAQATSFEAEAVGLIVEASDAFHRIGGRLAALLRLREESRAGEKAFGGGGTAEEPSLDDLDLRFKLSTLTSVTFLAALKFQEPTIYAALKNERQVEDQRRAIIEEIGRIADAPTRLQAQGRTAAALPDLPSDSNFP